METLNVPRLASPAWATDVTPIEKPPGSSTLVAEETEEEDSFFELQIAVPDSDTNKCSTSTSNSIESVESNKNVRDRSLEYDCTNEQRHASAISVTITDGRCYNGMFQQSSASASQGDKLFSKRKILPIEGLYRPQSSISLLKSAPKFQVFAFAQAKSIVAAEKAEAGEKQGINRGNGQSTSRFKTEKLPPFTGSECARKAEDNTDIERTRKFSSDDIVGPKRFSREVIQKYLRLLKPLYIKVSKKHGSSETVAGEFPAAAATSSSPQKLAGSWKPPTGLRMIQLGKSRSAATCRVDSVARMDDSLVQLQDGIQSAILHCKRSLSASRDFSPLSRCDAGSAHDDKMVDLGRFSMD